MRRFGAAKQALWKFLKLLALCTRAAPTAPVRHFGTPKLIFMFSAIANAQNWRGLARGLKRKNAVPRSPVVALRLLG
jgi:hypothetical protein